jgi:hypothetical protein
LWIIVRKPLSLSHTNFNSPGFGFNNGLSDNALIVEEGFYHYTNWPLSGPIVFIDYDDFVSDFKALCRTEPFFALD